MAVQLQSQLKNQLASLSNSRGGNIPLDEAVHAGENGFLLPLLEADIDGGRQACANHISTKALPQGTIVESVSSYGDSAWSFTAKVNAADKDGRPIPLFLKVRSSL